MHLLRAPDPGVTRQGLRFALAGGSVTIIYLATTVALASIARLPFQGALAIGFCTGIAAHFTLQRRFVWTHKDEFALSLGNQTGRYMAVVAAQYGVTAASTLLLPPALGAPTEVVYLITLVVVVCMNFLVFRHLIFHARPARPGSPPTPEPAAGRSASESAFTYAIAPQPPASGPLGREASAGIGQTAGGGEAGGARSAPERRGRAWRVARGVGDRLQTPGALDAAIGTLVVLLIASPMLFTKNGFAPDFTNDIWLSNYQEHMIAAHLHPTLFLQTQQLGVFDPLFAFYGGGVFALTGGLGAILGGSTILAFEIMTLAAIAAAYGGLFWIARQLGVRGLMAHAPAIVFATSAYYITDLYGRGAWAEFMATSALALLIAAALRVTRGPLRIAPAACLVAASTIFSGSHNITLLWGTTLAILALALYWLLSGVPRRLPWRKILATAGLIALGVGLDAWFLLPDVSYAHSTAISAYSIPWSATGFFNTFDVIFDPLRTVPRQSETPALYVQAPVLALVWGLLALPLVWRYRRLRAGIVTALAALGGLLAVIMSESAFALLPKSYEVIQFAYRIQTYVTLSISGLVLLGVLALSRRAQSGRTTRIDRAFTIGLGLVVVFSVGLATWQLWVPNTHIRPQSYENRDEVLSGSTTTLPTSWNAPNDYGEVSLPVVPTSNALALKPEQIDDDRIAGSARLPAGPQPLALNIVAGPDLVHVGGGVHVVGRSLNGDLVVKRDTNGSQAIPLEVRPQLSVPVLIGRILTAASALLLIAMAIVAFIRRQGRRRRRDDDLEARRSRSSSLAASR